MTLRISILLRINRIIKLQKMLLQKTISEILTINQTSWM